MILLDVVILGFGVTVRASRYKKPSSNRGQMEFRPRSISFFIGNKEHEELPKLLRWAQWLVFGIQIKHFPGNPVVCELIFMGRGKSFMRKKYVGEFGNQ